jgi:hypothetical protein
MPLTVELWTELANPVVEAQVLGVRLPKDVATNERFHLLKWVDPWGDTVFNRAQCSELVSELELACELLGEDDLIEVRALTEVKVLAEHASAEPHSYLVFVGD